MFKKILLLLSLVLLFSSCSHLRPQAQPQAEAETKRALYQCDFGKGKWNADDWQIVKSPRWEGSSHWVQCADHIENYIPEGLCVTDPKIRRDHLEEIYVSMLLKQPFQGNHTFSMDCIFVNGRAPLLVFAPELPKVYGDHLEAVVYDQGINLWHHYFKDGKPSWRRLGFLSLNLEKGKKYKFTVQFQFTSRGVVLVMSCDGNTFGCMLDTDWPKTYYAGITGCEDLDQFFSFRVD